MPTPGEHKTVQARILEYAETIGWTFVPREEAEQRGGFEPGIPQMGNSEKIICVNLRNLRKKRSDGKSLSLSLRRPARRQGAVIQPALRREAKGALDCAAKALKSGAALELRY